MKEKEQKKKKTEAKKEKEPKKPSRSPRERAVNNLPSELLEGYSDPVIKAQFKVEQSQVKPKKQKEEKYVQLAEANKDKFVNNFSSEQDSLIAEYLSCGKSDKEVMILFKLTPDELSLIKSDPSFIKLYNEKVMSAGIANKVERIAKTKRIASKLYEKMLERLDVDDELDKLSITTLHRIWSEVDSQLEKKLGEDKEKQQSLNVLIMEVVKSRSKNAVTDFETWDPTDEFPIIDVEIADSDSGSKDK